MSSVKTRPAEEPQRRIAILGARVDDSTWDEMLVKVDHFISSKGPHQIMTPNPEFVMLARRYPAFRTLLSEVDAAPADGVGIKWAAKLLGEPLRELVPGSDLTYRLAERGAEQQQRWFLLGAGEGIAAAAGAVLQRRYPGLIIAGAWSGAPQAEYDDEICARIEAVMPVDVLLVAYGAPAQDFWIARNQPRLRIPVAIGVGGTLDLVSGRNPRPPRLVQRLGLIWLFRLVTQPWRWRRQLVLIHFVYLVLRQRWHNRHSTGTRAM